MQPWKMWKSGSLICICFHNQHSDFITYTSLCAKYAIKIFQMKIIKNYEIVYLKWRMESNCSWKSALCFNKRALLFDKETLGLSEGRVEVESSLTWSCLWHIWFKSRKTSFFPKKGTFNETTNPWILYLPKIGLALLYKVCAVFSILVFQVKYYSPKYNCL